MNELIITDCISSISALLSISWNQVIWSHRLLLLWYDFFHCSVYCPLFALWFICTCTQNPGFSAYTQHWVLYTWDELIMSISQVGKPLHEFEEDLSRCYLIWTLNLLKPNLENTFTEYGWVVWHTHVFQENVSIACEYLSYSDPTQMLFKWLIINANLCMIPKVE